MTYVISSFLVQIILPQISLSTCHFVHRQCFLKLILDTLHSLSAFLLPQLRGTLVLMSSDSCAHLVCLVCSMKSLSSQMMEQSIRVFLYFLLQANQNPFFIKVFGSGVFQTSGQYKFKQNLCGHRSRAFISQGRSFKSKPKQKQTCFLVLLLRQWTGFPLIYAFPEAAASENASIKQGPHSNFLPNAGHGLTSCSHVGMKARAPGLLRLPPSCPPHLPLHQSPHNYPPSVQEPAAHPLSTMAFGSLLISGAW